MIASRELIRHCHRFCSGSRQDFRKVGKSKLVGVRYATEFSLWVDNIGQRSHSTDIPPMASYFGFNLQIAAFERLKAQGH